MQKPPLIAKVDLMMGCKCSLAKQAQKLLDVGYVGPGPKTAPKIVSAAINCSQPFEDLRKKIKSRYKGNFLREAKKAEKIFYVDTFEPFFHSDEIERINKSMLIRSGRKMRDAYNRTAKELEDAYSAEPMRDCPYHFSEWWGIFDLSEDTELVGYIQIKRYGTLGIYSTILGHGDYLSCGIMPKLHLSVMEAWADYGIKWLMYAGWHDGLKGLQLWKRKAGFDPVMFVNSK